MRPQLVIPMTGISSRFTAAGYDRPKFLLELEGQYIIDHVIDMFPDWDDVLFLCNEDHLADPRFGLKAHLLKRRPNAKVVSITNNSKGPGWAVLQAREHIELDRPVAVNYCDFTCIWDHEGFAELLASGSVDGVIAAYSGFHPHMAFSTSYAYLKLGTNGDATDIQEKQPWTDHPESEPASSGTYGFASGRQLLEALDAQVAQGLTLKDEYYLSLTYKPMLAAGKRVVPFWIQHFMQWGTPQDLEEYREQSTSIAAWNTTRPEQQPLENSTRHSRVMLASGAGARFATAGYAQSKPALQLSGRRLIEHALASLPPGETVLVTRSDLADREIVEGIAQERGAQIIQLPELSRGQAESALRGIKELDPDSAVTVGACDAISVFSVADWEQELRDVGQDGLLVWVAKPYHIARRRPEQYGWVTHPHGAASATWIKAAPEADASVMVGTFTFGSARFATQAIEALLADDERVNNEFYLDSVVRRALSGGTKVRAFVLPSFVSVGTPTEYETVRYWQSCFHKWVHHPYTLASDEMVPATVRAELELSFKEPILVPGTRK